MGKEHKENLNANPALRIIVLLFDQDGLFKAVDPIYKKVDLQILVEHLKVMIEEEDE